LAALSWHLIEKPAQARRHYLYSFENWLQSRSMGGPRPATGATKGEATSDGISKH